MRSPWGPRGKGADGTDSTAARSSTSPYRRGLAAGLIVVALGGLAVWWFLGRDGARPSPVPVAKVNPAPKKPPRQTKAAATPTNAVVHPVAAPKPVAAPPPQKTPEQLEAEARAKDPLYDRHHIVAAKPLVAGATDQLIVTIFSTDLGDMPPFIPPVSDLDEAETIKAIDKLEKASADDTPEAKSAKEIVNAVKKELKKFLLEGGTVNGFLAHYANELQNAFEERKTCQELFSKSMRADDPQVARELYKKYNEHLSKKGIKPLTLNRRQREYLGIKED